ncbi:MAG: radical SAM protein [Thermodesulfobacteriota bacterium]
MAKQKAYLSSLERAIAGDIHPYQTCLFLTGACNLSCTYCAQKKSLTNNDMGLEEWKRVADIAYVLGNRMISLVGGEPLLSPYVLDVVDYISARDTIVSILTNGRCLNEKFLHALDEAGLDSLGFSIDTLDNDRHPKFGKSLTAELERILQYIVNSKFRFKTSVAAVVTKYNLTILPEMLRRFSELGIPIRFSLMVRGVVNHSYTEELALGEEDLFEVERTFEKLWAMKSEGYLLGNEDCFFTQLKPKMGVCTPAGVYQMYTGGSSPHSCEGGIYYLAVLNDGLIESCTTGVASSTHIFELKSIEDYRAFINRNKKATDQCKGCPWPHRWVLTHLEEIGGLMKL